MASRLVGKPLLPITPALRHRGHFLMKKVLVIAESQEQFRWVSEALSNQDVRLISRVSLADSLPLLDKRFVDFVCYATATGHVQAEWDIERIRQDYPAIPLAVIADCDEWEWEKDNYDQGVLFVFRRPLDVGMARTLFGRILKVREAISDNDAVPSEPSYAQIGELAATPAHSPDAGISPSFRALQAVRDFSQVLTHSFDEESLLQKLLSLLKEILGIHRGVVFISATETGIGRNGGDLNVSCAIGLPLDLLKNIQLSGSDGIGGFLVHQQKMLRRESEFARMSSSIRKEFDLLGCQVALPILDRSQLLGVALFDGRITGEPLHNSELELVFHLLEDVGMALRNIRLHGQLKSNHALMTGILHELNSACVLVREDLSILHANRKATQLFQKKGSKDQPERDFDFSDLPEQLGAKVYQVFQTGSGIVPYDFHPPGSKNVYEVTIVPIRSAATSIPKSVLLIVDDKTESEQLKKLEIETANLRLVKGMSERLAHEIGNAIVPLATHEQLLSQKFDSEDFRESLAASMTDSVKRISRLAKQMFFLARENFECTERVQVGQIIDEAFKAAKEFHSGSSASLKFEDGGAPLTVACDHAGLRYALSEVLLNALQANPKKSQVRVKATAVKNGTGGTVHLEIIDPGDGFDDETAKHATDPFYSTRTVGIGLGLTVANKIISRHRGQISILPGAGKKEKQIEIVLPA